MLSPRQIHLDFHTTELIPNVGAAFDPALFAQTMKQAGVTSATVFARCHHGWVYYPSQKFPHLLHPELKCPNLLLEQIDALHAAGLRAPVYITVQTDYKQAREHPEWLIRKADGSHEGCPFTEPGFYQSLCVNTAYGDLVLEQTEEVCALLGDKLDGFFFDIMGVRLCLCEACRAEMAREGLDTGDELAVQAFAVKTMDRYRAKLTALVRHYSKDCTIFHNAGHVGPCTKSSADSFTHFELESLPSGGWGYLHFPVTARYARKLGKDCMGMSGKFHTSWGDFHSLKNLAALEFECFQMLSFGFACSVGDQLEPRGVLNPATYDLIGRVFRPMAEREEWARPSVPVVEAALVTPESPLFEHQIPESIFGAVQMLEELGLQFDILDPGMPLEGYKLVILPDDLIVSPPFQATLDAYVAAGGCVLSCGRGGLNEKGAYPSCFGARHHGQTEKYADFLIADGPLAEGLVPGSEYVIYQRGESLEPAGAQPVLMARAPYFTREGNRFCSHAYTPSAGGEPYPAALRRGNVILFGHPLFSQYRDNAPLWCKTLVSNAIEALLPDRLIRHDGPSTLRASLLHQPEKSRYCLHLLSYVPVRKSATIDIIEERTVLHNVTLTPGVPFTRARLVPENRPLDVRSGKITVPVLDGYAIVELS